MKFKLMTMGLLAATVAMQSCKDEGVVNPIPLEEGTEIRFGADLDPDNDVVTRTYYGVAENNKWPIYWNVDPKDQIFIYSPQALEGRNQASYTVNATERNMKSAASITHDNAFGVQVGNTTGTYDFYGIYPASAQQGTATGNDNSATISGTLSDTQEGIFTGTEQPKNDNLDVPEASCPSNPAIGSNFYFKPDMTQCLMTAVTPNQTLTQDPVKLQFKPFATCIDVTVKGPGNNTTTNPPRITSVVLSSTTGKLAGDFTCTFNEDGTYTLTPGENAVSSVSFSTKAKYTENNKEYLLGIPLPNNASLNLQIFILPDPNISDLKVTVNTSNFQSISKTLTINQTTPIMPGQIHPVTLPVFINDEAKFNYSNWISQLDPRIYVSEVSLPGSCLSFSYAESSEGEQFLPSYDITQSLTLSQQFNQGIRVFQTHVWIAQQKSAIDKGETSICLSVHGKPLKRPEERGSGFFALGDVLKVLKDEMSGAHSDEFCVLLLSDWYWDGVYSNGTQGSDTYATTSGYNTSDKIADFYTRLKTALSSEEMAEYVVTEFGPETTIGDIKGKVLIKFAPNYTSSNDKDVAVDKDYFKNANGADCLFNAWVDGADSKVMYAQLKFGTAYGLTQGKSYMTPDPMLYIHSETGAPYQWDRPGTTGVQQQIPAYYQHYNSLTHNIFGLTYLGGAGNAKDDKQEARTPQQVADIFINIWNNAIVNFTNKPYGWVLFNCIGDSNTQTNEAVRKVISRNNEESFKLERKWNNTTTPTHIGDVETTSFGGPVW